MAITLHNTNTPLANDLLDVDAVFGNHGQNYPVITSAAVAAGTATISGTINSNPGTALHLEFFANDARDASGFGEGQTFIGANDVNTDGTGNASFGSLVFNGVPAGQAVITSTATNPAGDTSGILTVPCCALSIRLAPPAGSISVDFPAMFSSGEGACTRSSAGTS